MKKLFHIELDYSKRVFGLDCYRAVAILLVVSIHGGYLLNNTLLDGFPWINIMDGVELFFVLSGFLIGTILLKIVNSPEPLTVRKVTGFWKRRWLRTLPNYYLILLLNWVFVKFAFIDGDIKKFDLSFFYFGQNFFSPLYDFSGNHGAYLLKNGFISFFLFYCCFSRCSCLLKRRSSLLSLY